MQFQLQVLGRRGRPGVVSVVVVSEQIRLLAAFLWQIIKDKCVPMGGC